MDLNLRLHPQQGLAFQTDANEILYGGAAGGGKSHLMRVAAISLCTEIPGFQAYLFRRLSDDLYKNHMEGPGGFFALLDGWFQAGLAKWNASKNFISFWNGAKIWLCHCQYEKDRFKYQGVEIHGLFIDELTHFTETIYRYLRGRCRLGGLQLPEHLRHKLPLILCGSNPGGIGHNWVKRMFVNNGRPLDCVRMPPKEGGMLRQYIPARLRDNPTLEQNDPNYINMLYSLGDPILVRAMLEGDWDIVAGGAVDDVWRNRVHVLPSFPIPLHWHVFRTFDWGSAHPFSVGWWAKTNGEEALFNNGIPFCPPANTLVRFAEWYGTLELGSNLGLRMSSTDVAKGILERERRFIAEGLIETTPQPGPADNQIFAVTDDETETIAKKMGKAGVTWTRSDKSKGSRINGLEMFRTRLKSAKDGDGPGIYFTSNCRGAIDTLPVLPRDERNPEDVDTNAEDHIYDEVRYACLSEPVVYATNINVKFPS